MHGVPEGSIGIIVSYTLIDSHVPIRPPKDTFLDSHRPFSNMMELIPGQLVILADGKTDKLDRIWVTLKILETFSHLAASIITCTLRQEAKRLAIIWSKNIDV